MLLPQVLLLYVTGMGKAFWNGLKIAFTEKEGISRMELQMAVKAVSFSGKIAIITAVISAVFGVVAVLYTMTDLTTLGPCISVIALSMLYGQLLYISDTTVKKHVTHILDKTKCADREELADMVKGL